VSCSWVRGQSLAQSAAKLCCLCGAQSFFGFAATSPPLAPISARDAAKT
jgi:hypothetical protein